MASNYLVACIVCTSLALLCEITSLATTSWIKVIPLTPYLKTILICNKSQTTLQN